MKNLSDERAFQLLMTLAEAGQLKLQGPQPPSNNNSAAAQRDAEYILTLLDKLTTKWIAG